MFFKAVDRDWLQSWPNKVNKLKTTPPPPPTPPRGFKQTGSREEAAAARRGDKQSPGTLAPGETEL